MITVTHKTTYGFSLKVRKGSFMDLHLAEQGGTSGDPVGWYAKAESELVKVIVRPGDLTVDVGAHVGWFSCLMAACGAHVIAFEPNPEMYELCRENTAGRDVTLLCAAAMDFEGEAALYLPSDADDGWGSLAAADGGDRSRPIAVPVWRLENVIPEGRIRLVKIDVEGAEVPALQGLGARLADVDLVLIECVDRPERAAYIDSTVAGINQILLGAGFRAHAWIAGTWQSVPSAWSAGDHDFLFVNQGGSL